MTIIMVLADAIELCFRNCSKFPVSLSNKSSAFVIWVYCFVCMYQ